MAYIKANLGGGTPTPITPTTFINHIATGSGYTTAIRSDGSSAEIDAIHGQINIQLSNEVTNIKIGATSGAQLRIYQTSPWTMLQNYDPGSVNIDYNVPSGTEVTIYGMQTTTDATNIVIS